MLTLLRQVLPAMQKALKTVYQKALKTVYQKALKTVYQKALKTVYQSTEDSVSKQKKPTSKGISPSSMQLLYCSFHSISPDTF